MGMPAYKPFNGADKFDLIHNNFDFLPLTYSRLIRTPMVTTIHGFSSQKILSVYKKYNSTSHYVSISNSDRSPELDYTATVYNGINTNEFTFRSEPKDYLAFVNIAMNKNEEDAMRYSVNRGKPFGSDLWSLEMIKEYGLESTVRNRGRQIKGT